MRYSFVMLGLLAFVCATSGYVMEDQDDDLSDTDDLPEVAVFEDDDGNSLEDSDDVNIELRNHGRHKHHHGCNHRRSTRRRRRTTTTTSTTTTTTTPTTTPTTTTVAAGK